MIPSAIQSVADFIGTAVAGIICCLFCILKLWTQNSQSNRNWVSSTFWCIGMNVLWHPRTLSFARRACWLYTGCNSCMWHYERRMLAHVYFQWDRKKSYQMKQSSFNTKIEKKRCYKRQDSWRSKHLSFRNSLYAESNLIHTFPISPAACREQLQMAAVLIFAVRKKTHWVKHCRVSCSKRDRKKL